MMIHLKTLGYGAILSLACGLSGCYFMDDPYYDRPGDYDARHHGHKHAARGTTQQNNDVVVANTSSSSTEQKAAAHAKEPLQKATPGPKRAAAPQLPVIQQ